MRRLRLLWLLPQRSVYPGSFRQQYVILYIIKVAADVLLSWILFSTKNEGIQINEILLFLDRSI